MKLGAMVAVALLLVGSTKKDSLSKRARQSHKVGMGRTPKAFANLPWGAHTEIKPWSSRLGLGMRLTSFWKNDNTEKPKERCQNDCRKMGVKRWRTRDLDRREWASLGQT
jgi:hypothetical protein